MSPTNVRQQSIDSLVEEAQDGAKLLLANLAAISERLRRPNSSPKGFSMEPAFDGEPANGLPKGNSAVDVDEIVWSDDDMHSSIPQDSRHLMPSSRGEDSSRLYRTEEGSPTSGRLRPSLRAPSTSDNLMDTIDGLIPQEREPVQAARPIHRKSVGQQAAERAARALRQASSEEVVELVRGPNSGGARSLSFKQEVEHIRQRSSGRGSNSANAPPRLSGHSSASSDHTGNGSAVGILEVRHEWRTMEDAEIIAFHAVENEGEITRGISKDTLHLSRFNPFGGRGHHHAGTASAETPPSGSLFESERSRGLRISWITHPRSRQRLLWDVAGLIFIVYDAVAIPMYAADMREDPRHVAMPYACAVFWLLDIVMSCRTGFFDGLRYERGMRACMLHYFRTWFAFDVTLLVPEWCLALLAIGGDYSTWFDYLHKVLWVCPLLRIAKLHILLGRLENCTVSSYETLGFSLLRIVFFLLMLVHFLSCGWYAIGVSRHGQWVDTENLLSEDIYYKYAGSARWVLAQINGRTDLVEDRTMAERLYTVLCALIAVVVMSIFISSLTTKMLELEKVMSEAHRNSRLLDMYLRHHGKVSSNTAFYARTYFRKLSHMQKDKEFEESALGLLPQNVQRDLLYEVRMPFLAKHDFFHEVDSDFQRAMRSVCAYAVKLIKVRGLEILFEKDDVCQRMLFMERGECRYATGETGTPRMLILAASQQKSRTFTSMITPGTSMINSGGAATPSGFTLPGQAVDHPAGVNPEALGEPVRKGMWVSEPALWMSWLNRGELVASTDSTLLSVEADKLAEVVRIHKDLELRTQIYAHIFRSKFIASEPLSDIIMLPLVEHRIQSIIHTHAAELGAVSQSVEVSCEPLAESS
mmetsp:Transcript_43785/g.103481  ORF Transcript_43785/g.103481 Transcript_43785/m.103481 type:complete len:869 (-) Transcript_43785:163-2769(-)|eukprot:CAMPEP_0178393966 /NCGR_PEP_ID=MMETSP0689_2-20121128/12458_1 /TAXON_ID=160604 /ORGANISM="Amphidinium massartii, Strain CS-259" /LENGTH=868 /DNA_ID=CAMNT_0020014571 /DNA_START=172 /DNA_END=2778 /DNA_ORIENTATION=+